MPRFEFSLLTSKKFYRPYDDYGIDIPLSISPLLLANATGQESHYPPLGRGEVQGVV